MSLPERVNVMRVISYDVATVVEQIRAEREHEIMYDKRGARPLSSMTPITIEDVVDRIENYCYDDFAGEVRLADLIFQDENGTEL